VTHGDGRVTLTTTESGGTEIGYVYEAEVGGKVAAVGGRLLDGAANVIIGEFFQALARHASGAGPGGIFAKIAGGLRTGLAILSSFFRRDAS